MNQQNDNELYKKLLELLPEYVLGNISEDNRIFFESNYCNFPDLVDEVNDGKDFFERLNQMDFKKVFAEHTRNISVKVHEKRTKNKRPLAFIPRFVVPTLGLLLIVFFVWTAYFGSEQRIIHINQNGMELLNTDLIEQIIDNESDDYVDFNYSTIDDVFSSITSKLNMKPYLDESINDIFLDEYEEIFELAYYNSPEIFWGTGSNMQISLINQLNNMTEDEFQVLLEELDNYENTIF